MSRTPAPPARRPVADLVDFDLAARLAARWGPAGPAVGRDEAADAVGRLRRAAADAVEPVAATSRMRRDPAAGEEPPALVVDRASWTRANVEAFRSLLGPVTAPTGDGTRRSLPALDRAATAAGRRTTAAEIGGLLAFLSPKVLGQFDVFTGVDEGGPGRLLLVAPNVVHVGRELGVDAHDFTAWVCLHEETHRLQFGANPWLRRHLTDAARALTGDLLSSPRELGARLRAAARGVPDALRDGGGPGLAELLQTPDQREQVARVVAVMSLLEGHADVVMDDVGPQVVPSVALIRERFTARRGGRGGLDGVLRRLLGLDAKTRQYADGARFVRGVLDRVGWYGLNAVWTGPETLPSPAEIADPGAWTARVHG